MKILDSNILIYSFGDDFRYLRPLILEQDTFVSEITRLEVLGFHGLSKSEEAYFTEMFLEVRILEIDIPTIDEAIRLRRDFKMKLGDSIVAATALVHGLEVYSRNTADFLKIPGLKVVNPIL